MMMTLRGYFMVASVIRLPAHPVEYALLAIATSDARP
jgi:hypothetical protein